MKYKKIILVGMPACGKTSVSKYLGNYFKLKVFDSDKIFEENYGKITDYFAKEGETSFRKIEEQIIADCAKYDSYVLSTGGGSILSEKTRSLISNNEILSVYLKTSTDALLERTKEDKSRPLLNNTDKKEKLNLLLNSREKYYSLAKYTISTDNKSINDICNEIIEKAL